MNVFLDFTSAKTKDNSAITADAWHIIEIATYI